MNNQNKWNKELFYSLIFFVAAIMWFFFNPFAEIRDFIDSLPNALDIKSKLFNLGIFPIFYNVVNIMKVGFYFFLLCSIYTGIKSWRKSLKTLSILLISLIFLTPHIVSAVWWNPISWFRNNTNPVEQPAVQAKQNNLPAEVKAKSAEKKVVEKKTPAKKVNNVEKKFDICKNLDGIQAFVPTNMYVENGICSSLIVAPQYITTPTLPISNGTFYAQAPDSTLWFGKSKEEAQKLADEHMIASDKTPPKVSLQRMIDSWLSNDWMIKNGGAIYGTMGLWTSVYEDPQPSSGMVKLEYYIDGILFNSRTFFNSTKINWDTTQYSDGTHELTVKAYDKAGNLGTGSVSVIIKNIQHTITLNITTKEEKTLQQKIQGIKDGNKEDLESVAMAYRKGELTDGDIAPVKKEVNDRLMGGIIVPSAQSTPSQ